MNVSTIRDPLLAGRDAVIRQASAVWGRFVPELSRALSRVDDRARQRAEDFQAAAAANPRIQVATAFATGAAVGRVVNRLGH